MNDHRKAKVYYKNELAGILEETDGGYIFQYDENFLHITENFDIRLCL